MAIKFMCISMYLLSSFIIKYIMLTLLTESEYKQIKWNLIVFVFVAQRLFNNHFLSTVIAVSV